MNAGSLAAVALDGSVVATFSALLRTGLALSASTGRPLSVSAMRVGDPRPGLRPQQVALIRAAALVCDAKVSGLFDGSTELRFEPRAAPGGDFSVDLSEGTAASVLAECLGPVLACSQRAAALELVGATHLPEQLPPEWLSEHWTALLSGCGLVLESKLERTAFTPKGAGLVRLSTRPRSESRPARFDERGALLEIRAISTVTRLDRSLGARLVEGVRARLWEARRIDPRVEVRESPGTAPGSALFVEARFETSRAAWWALGEKAGSPEGLGERLARRALHFVEEEQGGVDPATAERLLVPLALNGGGRVSTSELLPGFGAACDVLQAFGCRVERQGRSGNHGGCELGDQLTLAPSYG